MLARLLLFVLMPAGFIGSAWVTNSLFEYFKRGIDEVTMMDRVGTLIVLLTVFSIYCYFICRLFGVVY